MANVKYNNFGAAIAKNDMDNVTLKAMFVEPTYTPDTDTEVYLSDISANRAAGTTDVTLTSFTITVDNTGNFTIFDVADFSTGTITANTNGVVVYISTGVNTTSELLVRLDLLAAGVPTTFSVVSGVLTANVNTNGLFTI